MCYGAKAPSESYRRGGGTLHRELQNKNNYRSTSINSVNNVLVGYLQRAAVQQCCDYVVVYTGEYIYIYI